MAHRCYRCRDVDEITGIGSIGFLYFVLVYSTRKTKRMLSQKKKVNFVLSTICFNKMKA